MEGECQCRQKKGPLIERMHVVHTDMNIQKCSSWAYNTKKGLELVHSAGTPFCLPEGNEKQDGEKACERS